MPWPISHFLLHMAVKRRGDGEQFVTVFTEGLVYQFDSLPSIVLRPCRRPPRSAMWGARPGDVLLALAAGNSSSVYSERGVGGFVDSTGRGHGNLHWRVVHLEPSSDTRGDSTGRFVINHDRAAKNQRSTLAVESPTRLRRASANAPTASVERLFGGSWPQLVRDPCREPVPGLVRPGARPLAQHPRQRDEVLRASHVGDVGRL